MSATATGVLGSRIKRAKRELAAALGSPDLADESLVYLVATVDGRLRIADRDRRDVLEVLRAHGARPEGKRLGEAVDEALRLSRRGEL